jgi:GNAT superfamily N-acetyltransferase
MNSVQLYSVHWLSNVEVPLVNKFYREYGFRGKASRHELCAVVRDEHCTIIACAYVRDFHEFKLLAGVAVAPAYQGHGVARLLLEHFAGKFDHHCYTFPYQQLLPFYVSLGFKEVDPERQSSAVRTLYYRYRDQGRDISIMVYGG